MLVSPLCPERIVMSGNRLLLVAVSACLLAACTSDGGGNPDAQTTGGEQTPVTIQFWEFYGFAYGDFYEEEARRFEEQYPWIDVEITHFPDQQQYREALGLAFESGNSPDVFLRRHPFTQLLENGWVQPLDRWITPEWLARFPEGSFQDWSNMANGSIFSFRMYATRIDRVLYLNEDLFRAAGLVDADGSVLLPTTWTELRSMAARVTAAGQGDFYGVGIGAKDPRAMGYWIDFASLAGAPCYLGFDYRTGRYVYGADPAYAEVFELVLGLRDDGSVYPFAGSLDDALMYPHFAEGDFAMFLSGAHGVTNLARDYPDFDSYRVLPLPPPDDGLEGGYTLLAGGSSQVFMSSQTEHPDAAWLWVDWFATRGFHERMVLGGLDFSVFTDLNTEENIRDPHKWEAYQAVAGNASLAPFPPEYNPDTANISLGTFSPDIADILVGAYTGQIGDWRAALVDLDLRSQEGLETSLEEARAGGLQVDLSDFIFPDWVPGQDYPPAE